MLTRIAAAIVAAIALRAPNGNLDPVPGGLYR